jgi:ABC-type sugar transport system substrate-binding protein
VGELLAKNPDIIWAANEGGTVGAVTAVRNAGAAGRVAVFGTDLSTQLLDFLESDDGILLAVTAQAPVEMGTRAVEAAIDLVSGKTVPPSEVLPGKLYARGDREGLAAARVSLASAAP